MRRQLRILQGSGRTLLGNGKDSEHVKAQKKKIHEIFFREQLFSQMGMQKSQTPESCGAGIGAKLRNVDAKGCSHQDQHNATFAVTEKPKLPVQSPREQGDLTGLSLRIESVFGKTPLVETIEGCQLAGLKSLEVAFCLGNTTPLRV